MPTKKPYFRVGVNLIMACGFAAGCGGGGDATHDSAVVDGAISDGSTPDAAADAAPDAAADAAQDAAADAAQDAARDASPDAAPDAARDASTDAAADAATPDGSTDAAIDAAADATITVGLKKYVLAFHACDNSSRAGCMSPTSHKVYLAESNNGSTWNMVPNWQTYVGSVPDVVRRADQLYIYTAMHQLAKYSVTGQSAPTTATGVMITNGGNWVDPSPTLDSQGRIVLFYMSTGSGPVVPGDPAQCPTGQAECDKYIDSATEVPGSNGTQFVADSGHRAVIHLGGTSQLTSASDPDIFFDGQKYVLYISHGPSVTVWTGATLQGSFTKSTVLTDGYLTQNIGGVPAGHFDPTTSKYWTYVHAAASGGAEIRRAVTSTLDTKLQLGDFLSTMTGSSIGLGASYSVESPGFEQLY